MRGAALRGACWLAASAIGIADAARGDPGDTILVTGSRIPGRPGATAEPLVTLDDARIADRALTNVADLINEAPGIRSSVTPAYTQASFGQGVNFLNIYNLGSNRTLVLVDGRRMVTSNVPTVFGNATPGTQIDLNAVPTILVERVERISAGGAPAYGSDAIAGTVNVTLKHGIEGIETRATSGVTGRGDNFRRNVSALGGFSFASGRGNMTAAVSHDRVSAVTANRRAFYRANLGNAPNPCSRPATGTCSPFNLAPLLGPQGRSPANDGRLNPGIGFNDSTDDGFPGSVLIRSFSLPALAPSGVLASGPGAYRWHFAPNGDLVPYDPGIAFGAPVPGPLAPAAVASGGQGLKLFDYLPVTSRLDRLNASLSTRYAFADDLALFADALFYRGTAHEPVDLPSFNAPLFRGVSGPLTFRTDNPLLTPQARARLAALGYGETFQLSRAHADFASGGGWSQSRLYRFVTGARGRFVLGGREFRYEMSLNFGHNRFVDRGTTIDQQKFVNAVNVALRDGRIVCTTKPVVSGFPAGQTPIADPACVPLNLFGTGGPSPAALAYILRETTSVSIFRQFIAQADIGGSPFDLFGNPAAFNLGFERHAERAAFAPDGFLEAGRGRSAAIAPVSGRYRLDEAFGEVSLPLVAEGNEAPLSSLELFGRARYVTSSVSKSFTAWSVGGSFAPVTDVTLRGTRTRSFRAPAILELFAPRTPARIAVPDLCSSANIGAGPAPAVRRANCTAFLARYPNATPLIAATASVPGIAGGNPGLSNERADSLTWGAVLRPRVLPGLTASVDYVRIRVRDPIASLSVAEIAQGCFDNPDFDATDPAHGNAFCTLIRRDADGQVASDPQNPAVVTGFVNGKRIVLSVVEARLDYHTELSRIGLPGTLAIGGELLHVRRRLVDVTGVAAARSDGTVGDPHWQAQLRLRYARDGWGFAGQVNYTGRQALSRNNGGESPNDSREIDHFPAFATVDASIFLNAGAGFRLTLSATNIFDRIGARYYGEIVPLSVNDPLGRRFALSVAKDW